jgi:ribosome-binding factor A
MIKRTDRLNSLLREVIAEVIIREVRNPKINEPSLLVTVKRVDIAKDLRQARVYISMMGSPAEKKKVIKALQSAAGYISAQTAKKVVMRYFPSLTFCLDDSLENEIKVHTLLEKIHEEQSRRPPEL